MFYFVKFFDLNVREETKCISKNITNTKLQEIDSMHLELLYNMQHNITDTSILLKGLELANEFCEPKYSLTATKLRLNHHYVLWYINVANLVFTVFIPLVLLVYLNSNIALAYKRFRRRQPFDNSNDLGNCATSTNIAKRSGEMNKTRVFFIIVAMFILCHSLRVMLNIEEFITMTIHSKTDFEDVEEERNDGCSRGSIWIKYAQPINHLLLILNASMNFFIYVMFDNNLKQTLRQVPVIKLLFRTFGVFENNQIPPQDLVSTDNNNIELTNRN
jgi:hypothetical protein